MGSSKKGVGKMKICILHDAFRGIGGGENVALEIAKMFYSPIYTCFKDTDYYDSQAKIIPFKQEKYKGLRGNMGNMLRTAPLDKYSITHDFERLNLMDYDVIFETHEYTRSYKPTDQQKVIHYFNTPPLPWVFSKPKNFSQRLQMERWKRWSLKTLNNINTLLSNSEFTQEKVKQHLQRESIVVYPPISISKYRYEYLGDYFLCFGRIERGKRTYEIVNAFAKLDEKLKVAGSSWDKKYENKVKEECEKGKNIEYFGEVSEREKIDLIGRCKAVVHLSVDEPFGIVPVEAFASGKPVIGLNQGYTSWQIKEGVNGLLIRSIEELPKAIKEVEIHDWKPEIIQQIAQKYDRELFRLKIKEVVKDIYNGGDVSGSR